MKRKFVKCIMGICVTGMMSLGVYGCGAGESSAEQAQTEAEAPGESEEPADSDSEKSEKPKGQEENEKSEIPEETSLIGDIKEIGDGEFRIAEATVGETENGEETMIVAAAGTEVAELKTVVYDEDTIFTFRTIRDGGASYEDREGSEADLAEELLADMKGYYEGDVFHAVEILISKVIL